MFWQNNPILLIHADFITFPWHKKILLQIDFHEVTLSLGRQSVGILQNANVFFRVNHFSVSTFPFKNKPLYHTVYFCVVPQLGIFC